jgi:hypothetical protein
MAESGSRLALLILGIVVLTLFVAFGSASLALWLAGDWDDYAWGMTLTLKIMWGTWLLVFVATVLTHLTMVGWHFRKARPGEGPAALMRAIAEGMRPSSWMKTGATSFTITVVLVSLFGTAVLASVLIWIIGDWDHSRGALVLTLKIVWGAWWVLCIITVLVRVYIFYWQRRKGGYGRKPPQPPPSDQPTADGQPEVKPDSAPTESSKGNTP